MDNQDILIEELIKRGKLKADDVLATEDDMKKKDVLKVHQQKITQLKTANGRWQTYVKGENGERKKISAMSKERLYEKLYDHYNLVTVPTVMDLLPDWLDKKRSENREDASIRRYMVHWNKYYADTEIVSCPVNRITPGMIERFFHNLIKDHQRVKQHEVPL